MDITSKKNESQRKEKVKSDGAGERERERQTDRQTDRQRKNLK